MTNTLTQYQREILSYKELKTQARPRVIQQIELESWVKNYLKFDFLSTVSLHQLHTHYSEYMNQVCKIVPFTKKSFSIALKAYLKKETETKKIEFYIRSRVFIKGIELINFEENQ